MSSTSLAIGIDLGTTYSCVGVWLQKQNRVEIIKNDHGNSTTPSYVSFSDYERLVGDAAFSNAASNPTNTIYDVERLIGRRFSDPSVQNDMKLWPFTVVSGPNDKPIIIVKYNGMEKRFCPEEISAIVLAKMKETAETYLGCTLRNAVITVPAYFNYSQRRSTMDAANIAALNMLRIMDEPIAAAIAYGLDESNNRYVLVFDLGGGTFDVSLLSIENGTFKVEATTGDTLLGDEEFHKCMMNFLMDKFRKKYGKDMSGDQRSLKKLKDACEAAKRDFFSQTSTTIHVDSLYDGIDFSYLMTQAQFDNVNGDLYSRCMHLVEECIKDAKIEKQSIGGVVLVGGLTRFPKVQYLLQEYFQGKRIYKHIDPEEVIAYGATVQAAKFNSQLSGMDGQYQFELLHAQNLIELLTKGVEESEVLRFEISEAQKLVQVLTSERDGARKQVEEDMAALQFNLSEAQELIKQLASERDDARNAVKERDDLHFEFWEALENLTSERDDARKGCEERDDLRSELSEVQKVVQQLMSERDDARREAEDRATLQFKLLEAQKHIEQLTSERDGGTNDAEEREALQFQLSQAQKHVQQLISEREDARREAIDRATLQLGLLEAQKLIEQLTSERDNARKEVEEKAALQIELSETKKLVETLTSERDAARKEVEDKVALQFGLSEAQQLIEQLTSERDHARNEVEERDALQFQLLEALEQLRSE